MLRRLFITLLIAATGGAFFALIHSPLPWLLGSLVSIVAAIFLGYNKFWIPSWFRKVGLIVVGVSLGLRITEDMWQTMTDHLGLMLVATVTTVLFGMLNAWILHKIHKVDVTTSIFSNIPGGLSEMVTLGQSQGGNVQIISIYHSIRVVVIVLLTPFIVTLLSHQSALPPVSSGSQLLGGMQTVCLLAVAAAGAVAASRLKIPAPFLLGPLLLTSIILISTHFFAGAPALSGVLVNGAQILIGVSIGIDFKREEIIQYRKLFISGCIQALFLCFLSISLAVLLSTTTPIDLFTSILATAPGGIAEMSLMALSTGSDPLLVTAFQLFRVLFIVTVFSFTVRFVLKIVADKRLKERV